MGFYVTNSNGQLKQVAPTVNIPLDYTEGGTGITGYVAGDLPYGFNTSSFARIPLRVDPNGVLQFLYNSGAVIFESSLTSPSWHPMGSIFPLYQRVADNGALLRKLCFSSVRIASSTAYTNLADGITESAGSAVTRVTDTRTSWLRGTTLATTGSAVTATGNALWRSNHTTFLEIVIRTGASVTNTRMFIGMVNSNFANSDDNSTINGYGVRFSTVAGDTGFVGWTANGASQVITTGLGGATVTASTVYKISMACTGELCTVSVNGGAQITFNISGFATVALAFGLSLWATANETKVLDVASISEEFN